MAMSNIRIVIKVGIADLNTVREPDIIRTLGLGSCVGAVIYDPAKGVAGLAHVLLPDSKLTKQNKINKYKYADTAIPILIDKLTSIGARKYALKAKMAGGSEMFKFTAGSDLMRIGPRNIQAVTEQLGNFNIPIIAQDVGGNIGRTIEFNPSTNMLKIRKVNKEETFI